MELHIYIAGAWAQVASQDKLAPIDQECNTVAVRQHHMQAMGAMPQ